MMKQTLAAAVFGLAGLAAFADPAAARVQIEINLARQKMTVSNERGERYVWPVSTGRKGYRTPTGTYSDKHLVRMHYSRKYKMAPMPHSIFFHGGYAIHGTKAVGRLGRPASHGCIRLAPRAAARLFAMVRRDGARIRITGTAPAYAGMSEHSVSYGALSPERVALSAPNALFSFQQGGLGDSLSSETAGLEFLEILSSADLPDSAKLPDSADLPVSADLPGSASGGGLDGWGLRFN